MELSIIIVSYKCKDQLRVTLGAVFASQVDFDYEVVVVDNDSGDGTVDMVKADFPKVILIENVNEGFSKGNNRGLKIAKGRYKLLLNPDTKVSVETFQVMRDFLASRKDVGIATCKLVKADGSLDPACMRGLPDPWNGLMKTLGISKLFPNLKITSGYNLTTKDINQETELGACSGAFMFVSPECYEKITFLDEEFFMYGEDIDYCKRAKDTGFKVWYYPKTTTIHFKGQTSRKNVGKALYEFHRAMWLYYRKHLAKKYPIILNYLVYVGIWSKYLLELFRNSLRSEKYVSK